jgi:hypothetical protein
MFNLKRSLRYAITLLFFIAVSSTSALGDGSNHGGVVTTYSANGANGLLTIRVSNPFTIGVSGYVNYSVTGGLADGNSGTTNFTLGPGATITVTVNFGGNFTASTTGAQVHDSTGTNTATGWGNSTVNCPQTCIDGY